MVSAILVPHLLQVVLTFADHVGSSSAMSIVVESVSGNRDKVWRVVRAIVLDVVSAIILPIMRVIRWVLLAINESHSIHAVVLHVGVLVPPHD